MYDSRKRQPVTFSISNTLLRKCQSFYYCCSVTFGFSLYFHCFLQQRNVIKHDWRHGYASLSKLQTVVLHGSLYYCLQNTVLGFVCLLYKRCTKRRQLQSVSTVRQISTKMCLQAPFQKVFPMNDLSSLSVLYWGLHTVKKPIKINIILKHIKTQQAAYPSRWNWLHPLYKSLKVQLSQ